MPDIEHVQPGDLITAQDVNELIDKINELTQRVQDLKGRVKDLEQKTKEVESPFADVPDIDFGKAFRLRTEGIQDLQSLSKADTTKVKKALDVEKDEATSLQKEAKNLLDSSIP